MIVKLNSVRIAFATLFEPKQVNGEGEPRYSCVFIIEPGSANAKAIEAAIPEVAKEKWKEKGIDIAKKLFSEGRVCYLRAAKTNKEGEVYPGFEDTYSITASNKSRPTVVDRNRTPLGQADGRPYSGCFVNAVIEIWAQDNNWGRRINANLKGIQFEKDGDAFGASAPVSPDAFEDLGVPEAGSSAEGSLF